MSREWLQFGLNALGFLAVIALAVDRWVHQQGLSEHDLRHKVEAIERRLDDHDAKFTRASERGSEQESINNRVFGDFQVEQAVMQERLDQGDRDRRELWQILNRRQHPRN